MRASVVIPCRNGAGTIGAAVRSALAQTLAPAEVIVVDDASDDDTAAVALAAGARVVRNAVRRNAGGARNAGVDTASGELIGFLDADAIASPNWLERAASAIQRDPTIAAVGGRILNGRDSRYGKLDYYMNHSEWIIAGRACEKGNVPTMGIVYRRAVFEGLRFPESNSGEDTAFALAVTARGWKLWFDPEITLLHQHERLDWDAYWEKQVACGRTIYWTRATYDRPGKFLVRFPFLLFLFPHLWLMLLRMIRGGLVRDVVTLFPWFVGGELARVKGFFAASREGVSPMLYKVEREA